MHKHYFSFLSRKIKVLISLKKKFKEIMVEYKYVSLSDLLKNQPIHIPKFKNSEFFDGSTSSSPQFSFENSSPDQPKVKEFNGDFCFFSKIVELSSKLILFITKCFVN